MQFNKRFGLEGRHSFLSPSGYHWINYDEQKLADRYATSQAAKRGSDLHAFASTAINLGIRQAGNGSTLSTFVNDVLGYRMKSEQILFYSENCFGTADAIGFRRNILRIFDLKTGVTPAHVEQLLVYAAIFCLEYNFKPFEIQYDLRIYQNNEVIRWVSEPSKEDDILIDPADIVKIMDTIKTFDNCIQEWRREEEE